MPQWTDTEELRSLMKEYMESGPIGRFAKTLDPEISTFTSDVDRCVLDVMQCLNMCPPNPYREVAVYSHLYEMIEDLVRGLVYEIRE